MSPEESNTTTRPGKRRKRSMCRRALVWLFSLIFALCIWHGDYRSTWSSRAIEIVNLPINLFPAADTIRVLTYNIAHGRGLAQSNWNGGTTAERHRRLLDIAALIRDADADVVVLNEVDFGCTWSGGVDQAAFIAREAGYTHLVEQRNLDVALPFFSGKFGNAVLSRWPVTRAEVVDYPAYSTMESLLAGHKRGVVATIDLGDGRVIRVLAVHLEHRDEATRAVSAESILDLCRSGAPPLVAAGDFNSTPPGLPLAPLLDGGGNAMSRLLDDGRLRTGPPWSDQTVAFSFPSAQPDRRIDWVLADEALKIVSDEVLESTLSDHLPVVVAIRVP